MAYKVIIELEITLMELGNELEVEEGLVGFIPNDCRALNVVEGRPNGINGRNGINCPSYHSISHSVGKYVIFLLSSGPYLRDNSICH